MDRGVVKDEELAIGLHGRSRYEGDSGGNGQVRNEVAGGGIVGAVEEEVVFMFNVGQGGGSDVM